MPSHLLGILWFRQFVIMTFCIDINAMHLDLSAISAKREEIYRQAEKSMKHVHFMYINTSSPCFIHTRIESVPEKWQGEVRLMPGSADFDICIHTYSSSG